MGRIIKVSKSLNYSVLQKDIGRHTLKYKESNTCMVVDDQNILEFAVSDKRFDMQNHKKASKYGLALLIQVKCLFCTDLQTELS